MTFDELLAIIDDTNLNVYCATEDDCHKTLWSGHDYNFSYDEVTGDNRHVDIKDMEVVRTWATNSDEGVEGMFCVCVDVPLETWKPKTMADEMRSITQDARERIEKERPAKVAAEAERQWLLAMENITDAANDGMCLTWYPDIGLGHIEQEARKINLARLKDEGFKIVDCCDGFGKQINW